MLEDTSRRTPDMVAAAKSVTYRRPHEPSDLGDSERQQETARETAMDGAPFPKRQKWTVLGWRIRWWMDNGVTFS